MKCLRLSRWYMVFALIAAVLPYVCVLNIAHASVIVSPGNVMEIRSTAGKVIGYCTIGFFGLQNGHTVFVTAGHCFDEPNTDKRVWVDGVPVGRVQDWEKQGTWDAAVVRLNPGVLYTSRVGNWPIAGYVPTVEMDRETGAFMCKFGERTGKTCGAQHSRDRSLFAASFFADHGDSGAPVVKESDIEKEYYAAGILIGAYIDDPHISVFVPIEDIIKHWNIKLYTD